MGKTTTQKTSKITARQQHYIVSHIKFGGVKTKACEDCGIPRATVNFWFATVPEFKKAVLEAEDHWYESLLAAAMQRAVTKSDNLLMFLLKSRYPEVFDDGVRRAKWLRDNGMKDPDMPEPATIQIVTMPRPEK